MYHCREYSPKVDDGKVTFTYNHAQWTYCTNRYEGDLRSEEIWYIKNQFDFRWRKFSGLEESLSKKSKYVHLRASLTDVEGTLKKHWLYKNLKSYGKFCPQVSENESTLMCRKMRPEDQFIYSADWPLTAERELLLIGLPQVVHII